MQYCDDDLDIDDWNLCDAITPDGAYGCSLVRGHSGLHENKSAGKKWTKMPCSNISPDNGYGCLLAEGHRGNHRNIPAGKSWANLGMDKILSEEN